MTEKKKELFLGLAKGVRGRKREREKERERHLTFDIWDMPMNGMSV
jgi:hypothetical protein